MSGQLEMYVTSHVTCRCRTLVALTLLQVRRFVVLVGEEEVSAQVMRDAWHFVNVA